MAKTDTRVYDPFQIKASTEERAAWDKVRREMGYKSFSGFVRGACKHFIKVWEDHKKSEGIE